MAEYMDTRLRPVPGNPRMNKCDLNESNKVHNSAMVCTYRFYHPMMDLFYRAHIELLKIIITTYVSWIFFHGYCHID